MSFAKITSLKVFTIVKITIIIIAENLSADSKYDHYNLMKVRISTILKAIQNMISFLKFAC